MLMRPFLRFMLCVIVALGFQWWRGFSRIWVSGGHPSLTIICDDIIPISEARPMADASWIDRMLDDLQRRRDDYPSCFSEFEDAEMALGELVQRYL